MKISGITQSRTELDRADGDRLGSEWADRSRKYHGVSVIAQTLTSLSRQRVPIVKLGLSRDGARRAIIAS